MQAVCYVGPLQNAKGGRDLGIGPALMRSYLAVKPIDLFRQPIIDSSYLPLLVRVRLVYFLKDVDPAALRVPVELADTTF
jgi:hypothetical protein